jgi:predicted nuclease of predicted toxin-antitoxin system
MLADVLPGLESVYDHELTGASDPLIFEWARNMAFSAVISTDQDLVHLVERLRPPPKIIRIERCDFPSRIVAQLIRREALRVHDFPVSERAVLLLRR